jgi:hypothetical protein
MTSVSINDIVTAIREVLNTAFPDFQIAVGTQFFTTVHVKILSGPLDLHNIKDAATKHAVSVEYVDNPSNRHERFVNAIDYAIRHAPADSWHLQKTRGSQIKEYYNVPDQVPNFYYFIGLGDGDIPYHYTEQGYAGDAMAAVRDALVEFKLRQ